MKRHALFIVAAAICLASPLAQADEGEHAGALVDVLQKVAGGNCPPEQLSPLVLDACEQQLSGMQPRLRQLGAIKSTRYRGVQQTPSGPAEVYRVTFANGSMLWMVAAGGDGKFTVLWSPG